MALRGFESGVAGLGVPETGSVMARAFTII